MAADDFDKLVLHAGAGIFSNLPDTNRLGSFANNNPVSTQTPNYTTAFGAPPPLTNGVPTKTQQVFVNAPLVSLSGITAQLMPTPFYKTPQTYEWSLSVQSQLAKDWGVEIAYVGSHGLHEDYEHQYGNQPKPGMEICSPAARGRISALSITTTTWDIQITNRSMARSRRGFRMDSKNYSFRIPLQGIWILRAAMWATRLDRRMTTIPRWITDCPMRMLVILCRQPHLSIAFRQRAKIRSERALCEFVGRRMGSQRDHYRS